MSDKPNCDRIPRCLNALLSPIALPGHCMRAPVVVSKCQVWINPDPTNDPLRSCGLGDGLGGLGFPTVARCIDHDRFVAITLDRLIEKRASLADMVAFVNLPEVGADGN